MISLAVSHGAVLHPGLFVEEDRGHVSVHADADDGENLITLPASLLVPVDRTIWDDSGDTISITKHDPAATQIQRDLAASLVAVYNATEKISWAKATLPTVALAKDPAAIAAIRLLKPRFLKSVPSVADAFINTRVLGSQAGSRQKVPGQGEKAASYLMPVVDLINNSDRGTHFDADVNELRMAVAHAGRDTECFARYAARRDAVDIAVSYGYAPRGLTIARSVPMSVDLEGLGRVEVSAESLRPRARLDAPRIDMAPGLLRLSHVVFDAERPDQVIGLLEMAVAAYLARHGTGSTNARTITRCIVDAVAHTNLDVLLRVRRELAGSTGPAYTVLGDAIDEKIQVIDRLLHKIA